MAKLISALSLFALASVGASAQAPFALASLTVPAEKLPTGCGIQSPIITRQAPVVNGPAFPTNPWQGTGYRELLSLQGSIGGGVKMPDAPPPTRRELAAMQERMLADVVEGYRATYFHENATAATVVALRFKEGSNLPGSSLNRFIFGSTVVAAVRVAAKGACADAVESHLRSLK